MKNTFLFTIYFAALSFAYQFFMLDKWSQDALEINWPSVDQDPWAVPVCLGLALFLAILGGRLKKSPTDVFLGLLLITPIFPMLVVGLFRQSHITYLLWIACAYCIVFALARVGQTRRHFSHPKGVISFRMLPYAVLILCFLVVGLEIIQGGLSVFNLDFSLVYEFRREAQSLRGTFQSYLIANLAAFLLGLAVVSCISFRNWFALGLLAVLSVLIMGFTSQKSYLFVVFLTVAFYYVFRTRNPLGTLLLGTSFLAIASVVAYWISPDFHYLGTYTIRRVFFVPALVNFYYYDFFLHNPHVYWSDSRVSFGMVDPVYPEVTARMLYDYIFKTNSIGVELDFGNANTGWIGMGIAHAGVIGLMFYAVLAGLIMRLPNQLGSRIGDQAAFGALGYMFLIPFNTSSDLPPVFLTYGLFLAIFLTYLMRPVSHKLVKARSVS